MSGDNCISLLYFSRDKIKNTIGTNDGDFLFLSNYSNPCSPIYIFES
jgi:hypothetical protein